jgi:excisionase family DNA binding protein
MEHDLGLLTAEEAAKVVHLSSRTVRELVTEGKLHAVRLGPRGGKARFLLEDLRDYIERARSMSSSPARPIPSPRRPARNRG